MDYLVNLSLFILFEELVANSGYQDFVLSLMFRVPFCDEQHIYVVYAYGCVIANISVV